MSTNNRPEKASPVDSPSELSALGRELMDSEPYPEITSNGWLPPLPDELEVLLKGYEVTKMLGRGGMGAVYMGRQLSLDRVVAIKILSSDLEVADEGFSDRFKNEARSMAKLEHPGIVAVYDFGETDSGLLYIVMQYVDGTDVARMIATDGRLHTEHAMAITAHVCDALSYAHDRGIIHRDIKPANIMVGYDGTVKVADFGLAKAHGVDADYAGLTMSGIVMGTMHYMAPESVLVGSGNVDHRADVYAVGVMLYHMLTGRVPHGIFELPSLQVKGLDPRYDEIIARAMREDREMRYQNAGDLRGDLDAILTQPIAHLSAPEDDNGSGKPQVALPTEARPQRPGGKKALVTGVTPDNRQVASTKRPSSSSAWAWVVAICVILAILGSVWWLNYRNQTEPDELSVREKTPVSSREPISAPDPPAIEPRAPFSNSLEMEFLPVEIVDGPTDGQTVLFSKWETRVSDFEAFAAEVTPKHSEWVNPTERGISQAKDHPVIWIHWEDAVRFCEWLSEKEGRSYRLPTDHEWSCAAGLVGLEDPTALPSEKSMQRQRVYPWGESRQPPIDFANYAGANLDDFLFTAPVGSFPANANGLYDLWGNAFEWCSDFYDESEEQRVLRGHSWANYGVFLYATARGPYHGEPVVKEPSARCGFRVVLDP